MPALLGPIMPDMRASNVGVSDVLSGDTEVQSAEAESSTHYHRRQSRDRGRRGNSREKKDRDRGRRHRSRSHEQNDRSDSRSTHGSNRSSKWDTDRERSRHSTMPMVPITNMMMPGNMMSYNNIMHGNMIGQPHMDVQMHHMMSGINMMPNMMDPNVMMMNQQMVPVMPTQPIFFSFGSLLPPLPGSTTPVRRERPKGCRTVVVGGLPSAVTAEMVMEIFQRFGEVTEVKSPNHLQGFSIRHVRFATQVQIEQAFFLSGHRFKFHDQLDSEATIMYIDYAVNREDENEYERNQRKRGKTPPRVEPFTSNGLAAITDKIKNEEEFAKTAPTLAVWLERGECNKKNANIFYSLIQASNNQLRRLFNEKMQLDEEFQNLKATVKERFAHVVMQFEQVAKILSAAKHQRVSDHFTKQQRRNIDMWLKMTEEVENIKEEYNSIFEDDDIEKPGSSKNIVSQEKYEELKTENENLTYELEGYKNEVFLAKNEAERKFEKFKAHFIAQQALQNKQAYPPLPSTGFLTETSVMAATKPKPLLPPPTPDDEKLAISGPTVPPTEAKLISILTAFLLVHPLGASLDYLVSYVRSLTPNVTQAMVHQILQKYTDVFCCKTSGVGATIEHRWNYVTFDLIKANN
ncbi:unnamed protein product, partial [Iphiclides podalirius]